MAASARATSASAVVCPPLDQATPTLALSWLVPAARGTVPVSAATRPSASFDLDGFKRVNDTLGHAAGHQILGGATQDLRRRIVDLQHHPPLVLAHGGKSGHRRRDLPPRCNHRRVNRSSRGDHEHVNAMTGPHVKQLKRHRGGRLNRQVHDTAAGTPRQHHVPGLNHASTIRGHHQVDARAALQQRMTTDRKPGRHGNEQPLRPQRRGGRLGMPRQQRQQRTGDRLGIKHAIGRSIERGPTPPRPPTASATPARGSRSPTRPVCPTI